MYIIIKPTAKIEICSRKIGRQDDFKSVVWFYHSMHFFFPFHWPTNNCLQIMMCSYAIPYKGVLLQIIFCSYVIVPTLWCEKWQIASLSCQGGIQIWKQFGDRVIKQLLSLVIAKYRVSQIGLQFRQIIGVWLPTVKSRYFPSPRPVINS